MSPSVRERKNVRRYSFRDLVALRVVRTLLDAGMTLQRIRKAAKWLQGSGEDLAGLRVVTDGTTVYACRDDGEVLDALRGGQLAFFVSVEALAADVDAEVKAFTREREEFVTELRRPTAAP